MRGLHQQDEYHLCQLHCQRGARRREERPVGSNIRFLRITTFQRDYEFTPLEAEKLETKKDKGLNLFRWGEFCNFGEQHGVRI